MVVEKCYCIFYTLLTTTGYYRSILRVTTVTDSQEKLSTSWWIEADSNSRSVCRDKLDCSSVCDCSSSHDHEASKIDVYDIFS